MANKVRLTFLGTAANIPSANRNHFSTLLNYNEENILIDCGEGTQRQFRKAKLNPCKVTRILLTHKHLDHILGLPGFLATLGLSRYNKTLFIYGPKGIKKFINEMLMVFNFEKEYEIKIYEVTGKFFETNDFYLEAEAMTHGVPCNSYNFVLKEQRRIDKKKLEKSKLPFGLLLKKLKEGKNIVYEGKKYLAKNLTFVENGKKISFVLDTSLNKKVVKFVKDADLLVCESSFSSDEIDRAKEYKHLTATQTAGIAKKAKVKKLILVHIGQRYENNLKKILSEARKVFKSSELVNDFDSVTI